MYNPEEFHPDDLGIITPPCSEADAEGRCNIEGHDHIDDGGPAKIVAVYLACEERHAYLRIGGPDRIRALIAGLQHVLATHEASK